MIYTSALCFKPLCVDLRINFRIRGCVRVFDLNVKFKTIVEVFGDPTTIVILHGIK